jgi:hypothetical protein
LVSRCILLELTHLNTEITEPLPREVPTEPTPDVKPKIEEVFASVKPVIDLEIKVRLLLLYEFDKSLNKISISEREKETH